MCNTILQRLINCDRLALPECNMVALRRREQVMAVVCVQRVAGPLPHVFHNALEDGRNLTNSVVTKE